MSPEQSQREQVDQMQTVHVLDEVFAERVIQRGRWTNDADDRNTQMEWTTFLATYFGYVAQAVFTWRTRPTDKLATMEQLRSALVKLAATAVAWVEALDRRKERSHDEVS